MMEESLTQYLLAYGYLTVFLAPLCEYAGLPLPGDATLFWASVLARFGYFKLEWVIGLALAGAVLGDNAGYWIGRKGGRPLLSRWGKALPWLGRSLALSEAYFHQHGGKTVVMARFIPLLRVCGALVSGVSLMPWKRFLLFNVLGGILWAIATGSLGYLFGVHIEWLGTFVANAWILSALVGAITALLLYAQYRLFRRSRRSEAFEPERFSSTDTPPTRSVRR
jgi:membrane protein DedA with SNARE-associated domain